MGSGEGDASWDEHWRELRQWAEDATLSKEPCTCAPPCECKPGECLCKEDDPKAKTEY